MTESNQLLAKVLEIVEVMGEMRQQLASFIDVCAEKDSSTAKYIEDLQKRIAQIESESTKLIRELVKEEATKLQTNTELVNKLSNDVLSIKEDVVNLKSDKKVLSWKTGVIISFVSIMVTLLITYLFNHLINLWV